MELIKIEWLQKILSQIEEGELQATNAYSKMKDFEKQMKVIMKKIEQYTVDEIEKDPSEYPDFRISTRETFQYKENEEYLKKYNELKELEKQIKTASEMNKKGSSYIDKDWVVIEPVSSKYCQILTYKPKV